MDSPSCKEEEREKPGKKRKPKKKAIEPDTWNLITDKIDDESSTFFRFCPVHSPGVIN